MSRLKDALERAARNNPEQSTYSPPTQMVPEAWLFDDEDKRHAATSSPMSPEIDAATLDITAFPSGALEPPVPTLDLPLLSATTPDVSPQSSTGPARRPRTDFWSKYTFGKKGIGKVVVGPSAGAGLVEEYRRLGAALHHHQLHTGARTLMVTSAAASEGKTLTATNLALTLSHSYERRVLLIDADLRRPSVHEILRLPNSVGLSDSLRHPERPLSRYHTITPTLSVFSSGRPDSDPMAGLVSETMNRILTEATQHFDWVIVDTPPVALLPDANLLAAMIDTAILVIAANSTPYPLIQRAVESIGEQRILGVVLNRMSASAIGGAYNYYGHGADGDGATNKRKRRLMFWRQSEDAAAKSSAATSAHDSLTR